MNSSMYLIAVLAFCALPSALGLMCYKCTANETNLCTDMNTYTNVTCTGANAECARTEIMTVGIQGSAYVLDCVDAMANCSTYNASVCSNVIEGAANKSQTVSSCMTMCCKDMDKCNMVPTKPPTNASTTPPTTTVDDGTKAATTAAADVFRPYLLALLFIVLVVVVTQ